MFQRRSADRPAYGPNKAARQQLPPQAAAPAFSSAGFISHSGPSLDSTPDAQLIQLKRADKLYRSACAPSLPSTERMNIPRHGLDGRGIEAPYPCGHHAGTAVGNGLDNRRLVGTVEPDLVREVW